MTFDVGDFLFFNGPSYNNSIDHVAIVEAVTPNQSIETVVEAMRYKALYGPDQTFLQHLIEQGNNLVAFGRYESPW